MFQNRMKFGIFLAPFHSVEENPTLCFERDLELVEHVERLDYDEAWIGEHHSAGFEMIASPEIFIAAAAQRAKRIRFGTGVVSLPYHHPLMVADRINQLDHMTRGRVMFGVGPGALPSDAFMMGIDVEKQRDRMDEALGVIVRLLRGEIVTYECEWFVLRDARIQMAPYSRPSVEIAVANQVSPTGARAAGTHGVSLLSIGATTLGGFGALATNWQICVDKAAEHGKSVERANWRLVAPFHVAETREKARENVRFGLQKWIRYFVDVAALPMAPDGPGDLVDLMIESGIAVIGTPDDAIAQIERLKQQSGGFGTLLQIAHNWADFEPTKRSYELIARYVFPHFQELKKSSRIHGCRDESRPGKDRKPPGRAGRQGRKEGRGRIDYQRRWRGPFRSSRRRNESSSTVIGGL
jgi:limonene 1,2-monooxygenase